MGLFSGLLGTVGTIFGGPIGGAIGGLAGGLFESDRAEEGVRDQNQLNSAEAAKTRDFNRNEAVTNREFQREMSNTSYQRGVQDMRAAGLNPMLAYSQGGASVPSGSSATGVQARMENAKQAGLDVAFRNQELTNQTKVADSTAAVNNANAAKAAAETANVPVTGKNIMAQTAKIEQEIPQVKAATDNLIEQAGRAKDEAANARQRTEVGKVEEMLKRVQTELTFVEIEYKKGSIDYQEAATFLTKAQTAMQQLNAIIASPEAGKAGTTWGKAIPYVNDILKVIPFMGKKP